ncbi:MAG: helix-turn-helix domain-containing protein [Treponema sp.]|nr:helix-turn-helix domain-containing protein [Treponema sp.]
MTEKEIFVRRLRELMFESKYSQKQIAQLCHTTEASLSRYMRGDRIPKPEILANLATALHTTTDYLLGNDDKFKDFTEIKALVARSKEFWTSEQKKELSDILTGINERLEQETLSDAN